MMTREEMRRMARDEDGAKKGEEVRK